MSQFGISIALFIFFLIFNSSAWSYTAPISYLFFDREGSTPLEDNFDSFPSVPNPYARLENSSQMTVSEGILYLNASSTYPNVGVFILDGPTMATIANSAFVVNYRGGPPPVGSSFSMVIRNENNLLAEIGIGTTLAGTGIEASGDSHTIVNGNPYALQSLTNFTSLGLVLEVGETQIRALYMLNPLDGVLSYDDPNWIPLAVWNRTAEGYDNMSVNFLTGTTGENPVPIPASVWLLVAGLVGLAGIRKRNIYN